MKILQNCLFLRQAVNCAMAKFVLMQNLLFLFFSLFKISRKSSLGMQSILKTSLPQKQTIVSFRLLRRLVSTCCKNRVDSLFVYLATNRFCCSLARYWSWWWSKFSFLLVIHNCIELETCYQFSLRYYNLLFISWQYKQVQVWVSCQQTNEIYWWKFNLKLWLFSISTTKCFSFSQQ